MTRVGLHTNLQLVLLHVPKRFPQPRRYITLATGHIARRALHVALQAAEFTGHLVFLFREFLCLWIAWPGAGRILSVAELLLQLVDELLLLLGKLVGAAGQVAHLLAGFLLTHAADRVAGFAETVGCTARFG